MSRKTRLWMAAGLGVLLMCAVGGYLFVREVEEIRRQKADSLPVLGQVPGFSLLERSGSTVTADDLAGKVWIANFIFTHCAGPCPLLSAQMASLQEKLKRQPRVRLVSVTVDPERDTPRVLSDYALRFGADRARWLFLTGEKEAVYRTVREGFHLPMSEDETSDQIVHSLRFALIDPRGNVRAYYDGTDPDLSEKLLPAVNALLREK